MELLPIGTVCELKNRTTPVMIMGLYATMLDDTLHIFDYLGCDYPRGITLANQQYRFDHMEISRILYEGYRSSDHQKLVGQLQEHLKRRQLPIKEDTTNSLFTKFVFDENGFVVKASKDDSLENPFTPEVPMEATINDQTSSMFRNLQFDDQGYVISDGTNITENEHNTEQPAPATSGYIFDERGVVIGGGSETSAQKGGQKEEALEPEILFADEPTSKGKYRFDEHGTVVEVLP